MENEKKKRIIPSYTKSELAQMYMPHLAPSTASKHFARWLKNNEALSRELKELGVLPQTRRFTPLQVRVIFKYLGVL